MQEENNKNDIKTLSFGCRLNTVECEKIKKMLISRGIYGVVVNTCSVTAEAERQCAQTVRRISRENPGVSIFVTGCGATRNPELFEKIPGVRVISNANKMNIAAYLGANGTGGPVTVHNADSDMNMSKAFVQIQNGCNHDCTYCVTRLLRGPAISFEYNDILADVRAATSAGFGEVILTGVDAASYIKVYDGRPFLLADLCRQLLVDVPDLRRLRLSSVDPAVPTIRDIIKMMQTEPRFMPHLHLSMQSGSDAILSAMRRRHTANTVRDLVHFASEHVSFGWDIICGFPGETAELFKETLALVRELRPIHIHAFPYSPRPGTVAATMPNQVPRNISKQRVKIITDAAAENMREFMANQVGKTTSVLVESGNIGRTPDDIPVKITDAIIRERTICDVRITGTQDNMLIAKKP